MVLALPNVQVGFAGSRVRPADADPAAYTAQAQLAAGTVDALVRPGELRDTVGRWLGLLTAPSSDPAPVPGALGRVDLPATGWDAVRRARDPLRPRAQAYLDAYFTSRVALGGDRCGGRDEGMLCGFGSHDGRTIAYAAQTGTATRPAGYRTAARLIRLADTLSIPVLTLVDTPGAANDAEAERQGAGAAIADLFAAVATARTPLTTLVIGEGGSGGALAPAAPATPGSPPTATSPSSRLSSPPRYSSARRTRCGPRRTSSGCAPRTWWPWGSYAGSSAGTPRRPDDLAGPLRPGPGRRARPRRPRGRARPGPADGLPGHPARPRSLARSRPARPTSRGAVPARGTRWGRRGPPPAATRGLFRKVPP